MSGVLKVDASFDRNTDETKPSTAGVGGYMKFAGGGSFLFSSRLSAKTSGEAELLAVAEGLKACLLRRVEVKLVCSDDKWCVDVVSGKIPRGHIDGRTFDLVDLIQQLLRKADCKLIWIPREENADADRLARQA